VCRYLIQQQPTLTRRMSTSLPLASIGCCCDDMFHMVNHVSTAAADTRVKAESVSAFGECRLLLWYF